MLTQKLLAVSLVSTEWIIYFLFILSIVSIAIILERVFVLRVKQGNRDALEKKIVQVLRTGRYKEVEGMLRSDSASAAHIALMTIQYMKESALKFDECLTIALSEEKLMLESRISILGTLGNNAPFIGLFGTVLGIISAFHSLSQNAKGGPGVVMSGISEALVATALGLFIAIPAVAAYNYFLRHIKKIIVGAENFTRLVVIPYMHEVKTRG